MRKGLDTGIETSERAVTNVALRVSSTDKGAVVKRGLSKGDKGLTDACCVFDGHTQKALGGRPLGTGV